MKKLLLLLLLIPTICFSGEPFIGYGVGVFNDANQFIGQNKYLEAGYRAFIVEGLYWQNKVGYWGEGSSDSSRKPGNWVSTGLGLEVSLQSMEFRSGWGIGAISDPDSQLGGRFPEFDGEIYYGVRDKYGDGIGVQYEHISSAGLGTPPNHGRDFITVQLSLKW